MPIYCYQTNDGRVIERMFRPGEAPDTISDGNGGKAERYICGELPSLHISNKPGWPITCFGSGVQASQAGELREHLEKSGVPTEVTKDGDPVYTSPSHRRKALKARGLHDKNSFY